jgi:hypothetical protein
MTAVNERGVPGRLTKNMLSPSSLAESYTSASVAAETDLASNNVGLRVSSGYILLRAFAVLKEPFRFPKAFSSATRAVKYWAYSISPSVLEGSGSSSAEGFSAVISRRAVRCCSVAERW